VYEPLHYLTLIETKPNALDPSAPLQGWDLPETFQHLPHLLEARMGNRGKREFVQVLREYDKVARECARHELDTSKGIFRRMLKHAMKGVPDIILVKQGQFLDWK
jgi:hypothetical protein